MSWIDDKGINLRWVSDIDAGLKEPPDINDLDMDKEADRREGANRFRGWLQGALEGFTEYLCFVDYTVFRDAKIPRPYFYLVAPSAETIAQYTSAVKQLVGGAGGQKDCFSVAYHPDFVGVTTDADTAQYAVIKVGEAVVTLEHVCTLDEKKWNYDSYLLWSKDDSNWPPTTKKALKELCGQHTLRECLERFQTILGERRQGIIDSCGRPVTLVYCLPLLIPDRLSSQSKSDQPFSKIAAALFLGVSFERTPEHDASVLKFFRTLALLAYRTAGVEKAEKVGQVAALDQAIETFAHQIKGVANAMSTKWSVTLREWEKIQEHIRTNFQDDPQLVSDLDKARVLPAPKLIEDVRATLILWSQTRRLEDLYPEPPTCFRDVIQRAWDFTSNIRSAQDNVSLNFGESIEDLVLVWGQTKWGITMAARLKITGDVDAPWGDWESNDLDNVNRLCLVTRLLVAIFDNAVEHGDEDQPPAVNVTFDWETKMATLRVSNVTGDKSGGNYSRLRVAMKGNDVLTYLAEQLGTKYEAPNPPPPKGKDYVVEINMPSLGVFFPPTRTE